MALLAGEPAFGALDAIEDSIAVDFFTVQYRAPRRATHGPSMCCASSASKSRTSRVIGLSLVSTMSDWLLAALAVVAADRHPRVSLSSISVVVDRAC